MKKITAKQVGSQYAADVLNLSDKVLKTINRAMNPGKRQPEHMINYAPARSRMDKLVRQYMCEGLTQMESLSAIFANFSKS